MDWDLVQYLLPLSVFLLFLFCVILLINFLRLQRRYRQFMTGSNGLNLEAKLFALQRELEKVQNEIGVQERLLRKLALLLDYTFQGIGVVRFNAFQDTGGDLSFSVAFVDAQKNGVVITSIYGREEARTYAKPLQEGKSIYPLSEEEKEAIKKALAMRRKALGEKVEADSESE